MSIARNRQALQDAIAAGNISPASLPAPPTTPPPIPVPTGALNPYLRSPLPAIAVLQPDTQRQWYNSAVPQARISPLSVTGNPIVGAQALSQTFISESGAAITLQTNNANNAVQNKLNLIAGSGITLAPDSQGGVAITSSGASFAWGGDGSDGALDFDGTNTFSGMATTTGAAPNLVYTLIRDVFATTFVVEAGIIVKTAQNGIFAQTSATINGTLRNNGLTGGNGFSIVGGVGGANGENGLTANGNSSLAYPMPSAQSSGASGSNASFGTTGAGAQGGTPSGSASASNSIVQTQFVPATWASGAGGNSGATLGGAAGNNGVTGTITARADVPRIASRAVTMLDSAGQHYSVCNNPAGARAGGSGAGDGVNTGGNGGGAGGSGGGGGFLVLAAPVITVGPSGIISANGGTGGNGVNGTAGAGGNAGGGGGGAAGMGGNGGCVALIFHTLTNGGTISANGGTSGTPGSGGAGVGSGASGTAGQSGPVGNAGFVFQIAT